MTPKEIVEKMYNVAAPQAVQMMIDVFAEDVVLREAESHPSIVSGIAPIGEEPGVWRGRDLVIQAVGQVFASIGYDGDVVVKELVADGPRVIGLVDINGKDIDGNPYTMPAVEVFKVENEKITEVQVYYYDTARLNALRGSMPQCLKD